jgi:hypothetical protein
MIKSRRSKIHGVQRERMRQDFKRRKHLGEVGVEGKIILKTIFKKYFLFTTASRTALGPTQPPIQWVPGVPSLGLKRPGREADHSPPSSAEVKE